MTAPSNANTSGLEVVAWRRHDVFRKGAYFADRKDTAAMWAEQGLNPEPLVTSASAQAKIADLEARVEYLRGSRDGHAAHAHSEFEARVAAEARADRLAKALEAARGTLDAIDCPLTADRTVAGAANHAVKRIDAALQQETQK